MSVSQGDFLEKIAIHFGRDFLRCRQIVTRRGGEGPRIRHGLILLWFRDLMNVTEKLLFTDFVYTGR